MGLGYQFESAAEGRTESAYGCGFRRLLPWKHDGPSDLGMGLATVPPGGSTETHSHPEFEHFLIVAGSGRALIGDETVEVGRGDILVVDPERVHHFENTSLDCPMEVLCLWSMEAFAA